MESISRWRVEMTDFVPSIFEALVHAVECDLARKANQLRSLDAVIIGGEEANADVVRRFHDALPWIEVVNTYGPTEASIGSVFRSEEHTSELQSLMRISYAVFCLKKKKTKINKYKR